MIPIGIDMGTVRVDIGLPSFTQLATQVIPPSAAWEIVPAKGKWQRSLAGKVTVGLASHWPFVTDVLLWVNLRSTLGLISFAGDSIYL